MRQTKRIASICIGVLFVIMTTLYFLDGNASSGSRRAIIRGPESLWANLSTPTEASRNSRARTVNFEHYFSLPQSRPESLPSYLASRISKTLGAPPGTFRSAQYVRTQVGGMWIVHSAGNVCLIQASRGAVACEILRQANIRGVALGIAKRQNFSQNGNLAYEVLGLAPNWARAARVQIGHKTRLVQIHQNTYAVSSASRIIVKRLVPG